MRLQQVLWVCDSCGVTVTFELQRTTFIRGRLRPPLNWSEVVVPADGASGLNTRTDGLYHTCERCTAAG